MNYNIEKLTDCKLRISNRDFAILERIAREEYTMKKSLRQNSQEMRKQIYENGNLSGKLIR